MTRLGSRATGGRRWTALLGAACVVVAACSSPGHGQPLTTVPTASTTTTTPLGQVPAVIDIPYVQRVMDVLDHLTGEATRRFVAQRGPDTEFEADLSGIYGPPALDSVKATYGRYAAQPELGGLRSSPGDPVASIHRLVGSSNRCIVFSGALDLGPILKNPPPPGSTEGVFQLGPKTTGQDPSHFNPTPWVILAEGPPAAGTLPEKPCT